MNHNSLPSACPDCEGADRRQFLKTSALAGSGCGCLVCAAADSGSWTPLQASPAKSATKTASSETLVTSLYKSLSEPQRQAVAFEFNHPLRSKVDANWQITPQKIWSSLRQTSRP